MNDNQFNIRNDKAISILKDVKFELSYILTKKDDLSKQDIIMNIHALVEQILKATS